MGRTGLEGPVGIAFEPEAGGGGAVGDIELLENMAAMELDGLHADTEFGGNRFVGFSRRQVLEDNALGGRQLG